MQRRRKVQRSTEHLFDGMWRPECAKQLFDNMLENETEIRANLKILNEFGISYFNGAIEELRHDKYIIVSEANNAATNFLHLAIQRTESEIRQEPVGGCGPNDSCQHFVPAPKQTVDSEDGLAK